MRGTQQANKFHKYSVCKEEKKKIVKFMDLFSYLALEEMATVAVAVVARQKLAKEDVYAPPYRNEERHNTRQWRDRSETSSELL